MIETQSISTRKLLAGGAAFAALAAAFAITIEAVGVQTIQDQIARAGVFAPLAYIAIKIVTYVVAPLSSGPIQLSSGILFGLWPGTV